MIHKLNYLYLLKSNYRKKKKKTKKASQIRCAICTLLRRD